MDGTPIVGPIVVTIQDVTNVATGGCGNGLNLQLSQNQCLRITTDPAVKLTSRVRVGICFANLGDDRQLLLKYDTDPNHTEAPRFLENAPPPVACPAVIGSTTIHSSNPLARLAASVTSGIGRGVNWVLGVKPAYAFDTGGGGFIGIGDGFSLFAPAFPRRMLASSGDAQQAVKGTQVANDLVVHFTFVHDVGEDPTLADINGSSLTCQALTKGSGFATTPTGTADGPTLTASIPATSLGNGLYSCGRPFLAPDVDANQFKVSAAGVPDAVLFDVANDAIQLPGSVTFTATGVTATAPSLVSPANLSVFDFFPRVTPLSWSAVPGALSYELDRAYCESWREPDYVATCSVWTDYPLTSVQGTTFSFEFVGAQPGRWRVRAIYASGVQGPWSDFRYFKYLQ